MTMAPTPGWWHDTAAMTSTADAEAATARQDTLTKPPGSLGQLEAIAIRLAALQHTTRPHADLPTIVIFAGDHGIAHAGVSAFPQAVTVEMMRNFTNGGAAISVLAKQLNATLEVVNTGTHAEPQALPGVIHAPVALQTADFSTAPAMTDAQWQAALALGHAAVARAQARGCDLFIGGDMGIANTTAATALLCWASGEDAARLAGPGTGLNASGVSRKAALIEQALTLHGIRGEQDPIAVSRTLGGFEITALTGAYLAAAQAAIPCLVDGFICTAAAVMALRINPSIAPWLFLSHTSAEPGHHTAVELLADTATPPLLALGLRLGEGSGAAIAVPLLRLACALHNDMATFAEAAVSTQTEV